MITHSKLHFRPAGGYFGDTVPFFWEGTYHLSYLKRQVDPRRRVRYTPYCHVVSLNIASGSPTSRNQAQGAPYN